MASSIDSADPSQALEVYLKGLLDKMLNYFEKFLKTKEDLSALEGKLHDYDNLLELAAITDNVFLSLMEKVDEKLSTGTDDNYDELEKIVQKHEGEIREHIRIEQQLKLYAESIQAKLDDAEKAQEELSAQTKTTINDLKKENQKLTESLKQKSNENEKLATTIKVLEQNSKGRPQLQDRINHLDKRRKSISAKPSGVYKNLSQSGLDIENSKKIEYDLDYSRLHSRPDSTRKSLKTATNSQYSSPLKYIKNVLNKTPTKGKKTPEGVRVKVELAADNKYRKDLEALKRSYQLFYNPNKSLSKERSKERERERHATAVSKNRELKSIYSIPLVTHSSNSSLIHNNQNFSHRDYMGSKQHQRSNSQDTRQKSKNSFVKVGEGL